MQRYGPADERIEMSAILLISNRKIEQYPKK
jgi:hypothetical protein